MPTHIIQVSQYDHKFERSLSQKLLNQVKRLYGGDSPQECYYIINPQFDGTQMDALIINRQGIRVLIFKNWGGHIQAHASGSWTSDGLDIEGTVLHSTPYLEAQDYRETVFNTLQRCGISRSQISVAVVFSQKSELHLDLGASAVEWLKVYDLTSLREAVEFEGPHPVSTAIFSSVVEMIQRQFPNTVLAADIDGYTNQALHNDYSSSASGMYQELAEAAGYSDHNISYAYAIITRVFHRCIQNSLQNTKINFSGTFAKVDHLLKEVGASEWDYRKINNTRARFRNRVLLSEQELRQHFSYDLDSVSTLISLLYEQEIPQELKEYFPEAVFNRELPEREVIGSYLRVRVQTWNEQYIFCNADDYRLGDTLKVDYLNKGFSSGDWSYLKRLLYKGCQLNLINPREDKDYVITCELIIFEPDNLINITSISCCFTNYAEDFRVELIQRLQPQQNTEALVLGNLASQFLDESLHQRHNLPSYNQSIQEFFKTHALSLINAGVTPGFHSSAKTQKSNIHRAVNDALPHDISSFNPEKVIVEPSFFSEMLGIQGRMDLLQLDFKVLLEQKSGKGAFPQGNFEKPIQKEDHYVQLLLYMLLIRHNYEDVYKMNQKELNALLLYSKYSQPLLSLGNSPELVFRAIRVRNSLAWATLMYTRENGFRILEKLTPDKMVTKRQFAPKLWEQYQRPQIESVLDPIHSASPLEKAYFYRMMTFIANEHMLSKIGNYSRQGSGFSSTWNDSVEEKRLNGNIYDNLHLLEPRKDVRQKILQVKLGFDLNPDNDISNFRLGDIVIFYPYPEGEEPDARKAIVHRGTIEAFEEESITISLRAPQSQGAVFYHNTGRQMLWAIEHDFMEASISALYRAMHAFLCAPKSRRDLLMLRREPLVNPQAQLRGDYGDFNPMMLRIKQAMELFIIIGPPGTGKTSFGMLNTLTEELLEPTGRVLLSAYTNRAVDEICSKLVEKGIDFIRLGSTGGCAEQYRSYLLSSKLDNVQNIIELKRIITSSRVFVGTTTAFNSNMNIFDLCSFSLAIVDEASQILEPNLIGMLCARHKDENAIKKFVFIGDHKQLPSVVIQEQHKSKVIDPLLLQIELDDCRNSLFERLLRKYERDPRVTYLLTRQGRMHPLIAEFSSCTFYNDRLKPVPLPHQKIQLPRKGWSDNGIDNLLLTKRMAFVAIQPNPEEQSEKINQREAEVIAEIVKHIYHLEADDFDPLTTVGIIVPYRNQIAAVRSAIAKHNVPGYQNITIDTVERYQGSQRKYIIYGFTIKHPYQLSFLTSNTFTDIEGNLIDRKLNVALTRAMEHMILVGDPYLLGNDPVSYKLISYIRNRGDFIEVPYTDFILGEFDLPEEGGAIAHNCHEQSDRSFINQGSDLNFSGNETPRRDNSNNPNSNNPNSNNPNSNNPNSNNPNSNNPSPSNSNPNINTIREIANQAAYRKPTEKLHEIDTIPQISWNTRQTFHKCVIEPLGEELKFDSELDQWQMYGLPTRTVLNAISYGCDNYRREVIAAHRRLNLKEQVLAYTYYYMPSQLESSKLFYEAAYNDILSNIQSNTPQLVTIDIGSGPATAAIAMGEVFESYFRSIPGGWMYIGVEVSDKMLAMGKELFSERFKTQYNQYWVPRLEKLDKEFWRKYVQPEATVIFNMTNFFCSISSEDAQMVSLRVLDIVKNNPDKNFLMVMNSSELDSRLNSVKAFRSQSDNYFRNAKEIKVNTTLYAQNRSLPQTTVGWIMHPKQRR